MVSLEEFMASEKPRRRSKLDPFTEDILTLKKNGYSESAIVRYLKLNGTTVSRRTVNQFILNNKSEEKIVPEKIKADDNQPKKVSKSKSPSAPRTFDWQTPVDKADII